MHYIGKGIRTGLRISTDVLYSGYLRLPSISAKVDLLRPYLPTFLLGRIESVSFLPPTLIKAKLNALVAQLYKLDSLIETNPLLEKAERFCSYHQLSPFKLMGLYLKNGMFAKAEIAIKHSKALLSAQELVSLAKQLQEKIEISKEENPQDGKDLLDLILKEANDANINVSGKWPDSFRITDQELNPLKTKLMANLEIAQLYQKNSNSLSASMVLQQTKSLIDEGQSKKSDDCLTRFHCKIVYHYASAYFSVGEEVLANEYLRLLETKIEKFSGRIMILSEFAKSQEETLLKWKKGREFLEKQIEAEIKNQKNENEDNFFALMTCCENFPDLKEKGKEILKKISLEKTSKPFTLSRLYRNFEVDLPGELTDRLKSLQEQIIKGILPLYENLYLIAQIADELEEKKDHDKAVKFLEIMGNRVTTLENKDKISFACKIVSIYHKLGEKEKGDQYFQNFSKISSSLRPIGQYEAMVNTRLLMGIDKKEFAKMYYRSAKENPNIAKDLKKFDEHLVAINCEFDSDEANKLIEESEKLVQKKNFYKIVPGVIFYSSLIVGVITAARSLSRSTLRERAVTLKDRAAIWYHQRRG